MGSWRLSWSWLAGAALCACSMPNPAFMLPAEATTEATTEASDTLSSGTSSSGTGTDGTGTMSSGTDSTSTTAVEPTTSTTTEATEGTSATDTAGVTDSDATDTEGVTDTDGVDEMELCLAAKEQGSPVLLDLYAACEEASWGYHIKLMEEFNAATCPFDDPIKAVIAKLDLAKTSADIVLEEVIGATPAKGPEGLVQGLYALDLGGSTLPCVTARIAYPSGTEPKLLAQVRLSLAGDDENFVDLYDDFVPSGQVVELVAPIPVGLRGQKIDIRLITQKEGAQVDGWTLLWERPLVFEALP
ncbi:MAG: hypothetical protein IPK80_15595 [Nannocystis sp.]|nr:hypothetical protein [Nannocystis sp.]